ncbi:MULTISPECIES: phosphopyruvate hydratase [Halomicrobium]|uniref:Enolase n=2 Tax=Halomicrobium mukohataei TaxID=57705 RepID=C7NZ15_HALMD|nr:MULTISPECIES: phosphopyruvate hydratase [Halomicrobium]ACV48704.1 enolase [Halomicrobium mukohataei DSM 12286]QCD64136.1 phosphopyruvate hydratase [Halomicrobium mukohataei]QFR18942.1 phosphopyruvate hydratase [Halomicrobium sp. ZPS1]
MTLITDVRLRRVLDSRGNATVEADVLTESGGFGRGKAPSGASTGEYEAIELPANEAIARAREDALPRLIGEVHAGNQRDVDAALHAADGTDDFSEIGANSAVAISMAAAKAGADVLGAPLYQHLGGTFRGNEYPTPLGNIIGGGEHAADATNIQEFLAAPVGAPSVEEAVFANAAVHQEVHDILAERDLPAGKGDEGAWAPSISDDEAFEIMSEAVETVADDLGFAISFGLDVAGAELYDAEEDGYVYDDQVRSAEEQIDYIAQKAEEYDLVYVEDPLDEDDYEAFADLTDMVGDQTLVCGDDLFVTNVERLQAGINAGAANSILIKPNQIGTLTDAVDAIELARDNGYASVVSHRSGETEDATIAHLAVATDAPFIKTGAVGGERTAKLNELIRIEDNAV